MKKSLGSALALRPMPATVVGAVADGRPSWLQAAHVGVRKPAVEERRREKRRGA